jgi:hypothetical protein
MYFGVVVCRVNDILRIFTDNFANAQLFLLHSKGRALETVTAFDEGSRRKRTALPPKNPEADGL